MEWTPAYFDRIMEAFVAPEGFLFKLKNADLEAQYHALT